MDYDLFDPHRRQRSPASPRCSLFRTVEHRRMRRQVALCPLRSRESLASLRGLLQMQPRESVLVEDPGFWLRPWWAAGDIGGQISLRQDSQGVSKNRKALK